MAMQQPKTGIPQPTGNSNQATAAPNQVANGVPDEVVAEVAAEQTDEQLAKAWGFSVRRPKLSREALIGLAAILALLGLFGYVAVKKWRGGSTVVAEKDKVDKNVKPAGGPDPFADESPVVKTEFEESTDELPKNKRPSKDLSLDEEFEKDVGKGQGEPAPNSRTTAKQVPAESDESEFNPFGDDAPTKKAPKVTQSTADEMPDFDQEPLPVKSNRSTASLELGLDNEPPAKPMPPVEEPQLDDPALTKTEPIRLKQAIEPDTSSEPEFEEPVRVAVTPREPKKEEFAPEPVRPRKPAVRLPEVDQFAENAPTGFTESNPAPATTERPRQPTGRKHHPLLKEDEYLVEDGDNFCVISKKLYGSEKYYLALAEHNRNRVADPCRMRPGLIILAPSRETLEQKHATLIPKPKKTAEAKSEKPHAAQKVSATSLPPGLFYDEKGVPWYRVGKGDTLSEIAKSHLGRTTRAEQIYNLNRERLPNPNKLDVGQILRLPGDASQVRVADSSREVPQRLE